MNTRIKLSVEKVQELIASAKDLVQSCGDLQKVRVEKAVAEMQKEVDNGIAAG